MVAEGKGDADWRKEDGDVRKNRKEKMDDYLILVYMPNFYSKSGDSNPERMKLLADKKEFALTTPEKQRLDEEFFAGFYLQKLYV